jgi:uncharacterized Tic20 family protein
MEKKFLGGKVEKNLFFTLSYALTCITGIGAILAIVSLIMDKAQLEVEEKRELVSMIVTLVLVWLFVWTAIVPVAAVVLTLIAAFKAHKGETFTIPGAYHIAKLIIK